MAIKAMLAEFRLTGLRGVPLLMHNGRLANPLDPWAKKLKVVTSRRKKTDDDYAEAMRIEWEGGIYWTDELGLCLPCENIEAALIEGAKRNRNGKLAKAGVYVMEPHLKIEHPGPNNLDDLYGRPEYVSVQGVRVKGSRIMRTRPIVRQWSLTGTMQIMADVINPAEVAQALTSAGLYCGLGDYRPKYGRFEVNRFDAVTL